ncbi:MAG: EamA family transporter, partial [Lentisphaeria bacterium]|nr:EamA family transporter [Lentisphaeria bacterium]
LWCFVLTSRSEKENIRSFFTGRNWSPVLAGVAAGFTYVLVLMAMNYVSNVSYVQVFRQLGLIIGMSFGIIFLKEKCTATKVVGVTLILIGLAMTVIK